MKNKAQPAIKTAISHFSVFHLNKTSPLNNCILFHCAQLPNIRIECGLGGAHLGGFGGEMCVSPLFRGKTSGLTSGCFSYT